MQAWGVGSATGPERSHSGGAIPARRRSLGRILKLLLMPTVRTSLLNVATRTPVDPEASAEAGRLQYPRPSTPQGAVMEAIVESDSLLPAADPTLAAEANPDDWFRESEKLAEDVAARKSVSSTGNMRRTRGRRPAHKRRLLRQGLRTSSTRRSNRANAALEA